MTTISSVLLATRHLLAQRGHAYWEANPDSLRQALARQHSDTARLRTLEHLSDRMTVKDGAQWYQHLEQTVALAHRLHRPEYRAYQLWLSGWRVFYADLHHDGQDQAAKTLALDSMQAAINQLMLRGGAGLLARAAY